MELKHLCVRYPYPRHGVLIVPFMELKQSMLIGNTRYRGCLNRTFYGIETRLMRFCLTLWFRVLIVPFMELKQELSRNVT